MIHRHTLSPTNRCSCGATLDAAYTVANKAGTLCVFECGCCGRIEAEVERQHRQGVPVLGVVGEALRVLWEECLVHVHSASSR